MEGGEGGGEALPSLELPGGGLGPWRVLTADVPPVPAGIRKRDEDFVVEEVPVVTPEGRGDHLFVRVEKRGLPTQQAVQELARRLGISSRSVGSAGRKDAQAVAVQWLSLEGVDERRVEELDLPGVRVLEMARHPTKLGMGELAGNRFRIRLRGVESGAGERVRRVLEVLARRGVPNYFGRQRFGIRGDSAVVGRAVLRGEWERAAAHMAGDPRPGESPLIREARSLFDEGRYSEAAERWPRPFREPRIVCRVLAEGRSAEEAVRAAGRPMLRFYRSAYQSWLFNAVLSRRVHELDALHSGDVAIVHATGGLHVVDDPSELEDRVSRLEVSATGPLFGPRMWRPRGDPARIEEGVLASHGVRAGEFSRRKANRRMGQRRPLRIPLHDWGVEEGADEHGFFVELTFQLAAGGYATAVLREVRKEE